jgi:uncharacterized protein (TIGR00297 family)
VNPLGWLTAGGRFAAVAVGVAAGLGAGAWGLAMLCVFLASGSLLTVAGRSGRTGVPARTAVQVVANGWTAVAGAALVPLAPDIGWPVLAGGLAAAQADTWATEIGLRSRQQPVQVITWQPVPAGTSGAVTGLGSVGGLLGALVMAALATRAVAPVLGLAALLGGIGGAVTDSVLGATVQGRWQCDTCGTAGEQRRAPCGHATRPVRGWPWVDNHVVNAAGTGAGALVALTVFSVVS